MPSIKGLQKTTLVDYPGKVATTIFFSGCSFRCGFCHNPNLVKDSEGEEYSEKEILDFLEKRKGILDGVCLTGGEPLMYPGLKELIRKVKEMGYLAKLDTNGSFPDRLKEVIPTIDYIAMDIKSDRMHYFEAAGCRIDMKKIEDSIRLIMDSTEDYEFRSTIVPDFFDEKIMENIGKWIKGAKRYCIQQFRSDSQLLDRSFVGKKAYPKEVLDRFREVMDKYVEEVVVRE